MQADCCPVHSTRPQDDCWRKNVEPNQAVSLQPNGGEKPARLQLKEKGRDLFYLLQLLNKFFDNFDRKNSGKNSFLIQL